jgi:hypothetical protein
MVTSSRSPSMNRIEKRLFNHRSKTSSSLTKSRRSVRLLIGSLTDVELKTKIVKCENEEEEERKTYAIDDCQELIDLLWKSFDGIVIFSSHSFIMFFEQFHLRRFAQSSPASEFLPDEGEDLVLISTVSQSRSTHTIVDDREKHTETNEDHEKNE